MGIFYFQKVMLFCYSDISDIKLSQQILRNGICYSCNMGARELTDTYARGLRANDILPVVTS